MSTTPSPGLPAQARYRTTFRVLGLALVGLGLLLAAIGLLDFFASFGDPAAGFPTRFPLVFLGFPLLAVGSWLVKAGYLGAASRYVAGETMPVVKDSASYLTDGEGVLGIGRTAGDADPGPYCRSCGTRNDGAARFCDGCGHSLA